ncbi:MAG: IS21 family transposase [Coriobacteriia bacterium]|nr:IS21 family transposase [Coriobacteriia bacterium]
MLRLEDWVDIVSMHKAGASISRIAREFGISRNTVKATLRRDGPPEYHRKPMPSKLDPYKDYLLERLREFPELSVRRLLDEIRALGYGGGISILKDFTRPHRVPRKTTVVRFETPPGEQAQVDYAELGSHDIAGVPTRVYAFVMLLGFSRFLYVEFATSCATDAFLSAHARAFAYFGGMPRRVLYDNAKVVALVHSRTVVTFNEALMDFAGRFGFSPQLCRPARPQTKGKVERSIGYVKDAFLVGRTFTDVEDMNTQVLAWLEAEANVRKHGTTGERPVDRLTREGLTPVSEALPWVPTYPLVPPHSPRRPSFAFTSSPRVEVRPLSVYEEVCP